MPERQPDKEFPGEKLPRDFLFEEVARQAHLREGPSGVQDFVRIVQQHSPRSLRDLAGKLSWPVPVAAAVRRELEKRDLLSRGGGIQLTEQGRQLFGACAEESLVQTCLECQGTGLKIPEILVDQWLPEFEKICELRPEVDVSLDQALATPMTNLKRAFYLVFRLDMAERTGVFLGDDDWTSASLGLLIHRMWPELNYKLVVLDIDERVCEQLSAWAEKSQVNLLACPADLRSVRPEDFNFKADFVVTDPPYTHEGLDLFCAWASHFLPPDRGDFLLSYPRRDPVRQARVEMSRLDAGFSLYQMFLGFNHYEGNALHAGQSTWWHLKKAGQCRISLEELLKQPPGREIYTRYSAYR